MQRIKRFMWMGVMIVLVAGSITLVSERRAIAQAVRAAFVENVDEPGRNPYSQSSSCLGSDCSLSLPPIPGGKRLVGTYLNIGALGDQPALLELRGHGPNPLFFAPTPVGNVANIVSTPIRVFFDAGETPVIGCIGCPNGTQATLNGYYVNLP